MKRLLLRALLISICTITLLTIKAQTPELGNIYPEAKQQLDSVKITLKEHNDILIKSGLNPLDKTHALVNEDETVWLYYEIPLPEEGEDEVLPNIPLSKETALNKLANEQIFQSAQTGATSISGLSFAADAGLSGFFHIPPDPSGAVGTTHVCHVVNTSIHCHTKAGATASGFPQSMATFFTSLSPANNGFDPKIIWDQYENRFVVVHLVKTQTSDGDANNSSRVLIAVSATSDPTGTWYFQAIDVEQNIGGNDCWFDYPGFAVDDQAIYVTGNYFRLSNNASCNASDVIIIDKGVSGGIYDGTVSTNENPSTNSDFDIYNPVTEAGTGFDLTNQPAHTFGAVPGSVGTWLLGYTGLSNGVTEFVQTFRITNPLSSPTFSQSTIAVSDFDNTAATMPDAPQSGSATDIETNNRRMLNAVWRNNELWGVTTIVPSSGANAGEATAYWIKLNATASTTTVSNSGEIGGEDIVAGTYTYMASIAVNSSGNAGVVFSASASTLFAGAYAVGIFGSTGTLTSTQTVQAGVDDYVRTFGGDNRYGDYSKMALDPSDDGFWAINQAAIANGNATTGPEDGQWQIFIEEMEILDNALPVELILFNAIPEDRTAILSWQTASETNNHGFYIEQYKEGVFEEIAFVPGAGTTLEKQSYSLRIDNLFPDTYLFRIKQVDFDGKSSLSPVKSVTIKNNEKIIISKIAPNPVQNNTRFSIFTEEAQQFKITISDINGRTIKSVYEGELEAKTPHDFEMNLTDLSNGIYTLQIQSKFNLEVQKIMVNK